MNLTKLVHLLYNAGLCREDWSVITWCGKGWDSWDAPTYTEAPITCLLCLEASPEMYVQMHRIEGLLVEPRYR